MTILLVAVVLLVFAVVLLLVLLLRLHMRHELLQARIPKLLEEARVDSRKVSRSVVTGLVAEQLAALLPEFRFNPRDAFFLGKPIDYIIFDGLDGGDLKRIVLLEVKTGRSQLNGREVTVRRCVENGDVVYQVLRLLPRVDNPSEMASVVDDPSRLLDGKAAPTC